MGCLDISEVINDIEAKEQIIRCIGSISPFIFKIRQPQYLRGMNMNRFTVLLLSVFLTTSTLAQQFSKKTIKRDVGFLADDALEGRGVGSRGEQAAALWIAKSFQKYGLQPKGDSVWFQKFSFVPHGAIQVHGSGDSAKLGMQLVKEHFTQNVVGYIDNGQPYTVIIGAHYDHLGWGDENSLFTGGRAIHNGADDNASGVAGMLSLAQWLATKNAPKGHNYLFIAFSGEEKGLWGSNYFTKHPTIDFSTVSYMLNLDMVGRLNAEKSLAVNGVGTSPEWMNVLPNIQRDGIKIVTSESGVGASDHTSFYLVDLPVLHFFTGQHEDYHKPTDDADKVNYAGLRSVSFFISDVINALDKKGKLTFTKTKDSTPSAQDFKVTLGVMPDYLYSGKGLRIDGTKEGRPGEKAGLKKGDTILKLGDFEIGDIYQYMEALGKMDKGQRVPMQVERDGKMIELIVEF